MRKFFLLLLLAMTFSIANAQDSVKEIIKDVQGVSEQVVPIVQEVAPTLTETERIIDKYGGKAIEGFNNVVAKVTPMAEQGFLIAVKLQIAKGIANALPILFLIISILVFIREYRRIDNLLHSEKVPENYSSHRGVMDEYNITPIIIGSLIVFIISLILTTICSYDAITHLVAPEWYAIKEIIELFK